MNLIDEKSPGISIVIPCRNEIGSIGSLLEYLLAEERGGCEIIVADGRSTDGTRELVEEMASSNPRIVLVDNPGLHVSSGLNRAIRRAGGRYVLRMDAHTRYADDYIERCIETLERTGADNAGGPQLAESEGYVGSAIAAACHSAMAVGGSRIHDPSYEGETDSVIYGCWRREIFERVGYFDEEMVRNQDGEHNRRIKRAGGLVWQAPSIRSWYRPRGSILPVGKQYAQYGYWKAAEIARFKRVESWRHVAPGLFFLAMAALLLAAPFSAGALGAFVLLAVLYAAGLVVLSLSLAVRRGGWRYLPVLPAVFLFMQGGYGCGFIAGAVDFWIIGRKGRASFSKLTR